MNWMWIAIAYLACAAIFLEFAKRAPVLERWQHD